MSEWWDRRYAREHLVVGVLVGFLLAALIGLPLGTLLSAMRPSDMAQAAVLGPDQGG